MQTSAPTPHPGYFESASHTNPESQVMSANSVPAFMTAAQTCFFTSQLEQCGHDAVAQPTERIDAIPNNSITVRQARSILDGVRAIVVQPKTPHAIASP